ncbi:MAG: hypothetical protein R8M14_00310, partial [Ghiorsea sp.]
MYMKFNRKHGNLATLQLLLFFICFNLLSMTNKAYAVASHPMGALSYEYSGHINTLSIGSSLRTGSDADSTKCNINLSSSANLTQAVRDPANVALTGLPVGATVIAAHLYWSGSYDPDIAIPLNNNVVPAAQLAGAGGVGIIGASTANVPDYNVIFNGTAIASTRNMTDFFIYTNPYFTGGSHQFDFFGGYANVTAQVAVAGNATYALSGLSVNTAGYHCNTNGVLAGWALHVVYSDPAEPFRVVKLYDGFQIYRDANISVTPSGFTVPAVPKGKLVVTTWEGDEGNSVAGATFSENLKINVLPSTIPTFALSGPVNPVLDAVTGLPNQFNGTVNTTNPSFPLLLPPSPPVALGALAPWGVDIDHYNISAELTAGQTSLTTGYSSGADLVILNSEMIVVDNDPFADLAITKSHVGNFTPNLAGSYNIAVSNNGPNIEVGPVNLVDTLPAGLNFLSASGTGWTCNVAGSIISCSNPSPIAVAASATALTITVKPTAAIVGTTVTNTATVTGALTDNITLNNSSSDPTMIVAGPIMTVTKTSDVATAAPGSPINY